MNSQTNTLTRKYHPTAVGSRRPVKAYMAFYRTCPWCGAEQQTTFALFGKRLIMCHKCGRETFVHSLPGYRNVRVF